MKRLKVKLFLVALLACACFSFFGCAADTTTLNIVFIGQGFEIQFDNLITKNEENGNLSISNIKNGEIIRFSIIIKEGYVNKNLEVQAGDNLIEPEMDGKYSIFTANEKVVDIKVSGIEKITNNSEEPVPDNTGEEAGGSGNENETQENPESEAGAENENPDNSNTEEENPADEKFNIEIPLENNGYSLYSLENLSIIKGGEFNFDIEINKGYSSREMQVLVNGSLVQCCDILNNKFSYTVKNVQTDIKIDIIDVKKIVNVSFDALKDGYKIISSDLEKEILEGDEFKFTLEILPGFNGDNFNVTAFAMNEQVNLFCEKDIESGFYNYIISCVKDDININISDIFKNYTITYPEDNDYYSILNSKQTNTILSGELISFYIKVKQDCELAVYKNGVLLEPYNSDAGNYVFTCSDEDVLITVEVKIIEPEPTEPSEPMEPSEPTEPTEPSEPSEPIEPTNPEPTDETDNYVTFSYTGTYRLELYNENLELLQFDQSINIELTSDTTIFTLRKANLKNEPVSCYDAYDKEGFKISITIDGISYELGSENFYIDYIDNKYFEAFDGIFVIKNITGNIVVNITK